MSQVRPLPCLLALLAANAPLGLMAAPPSPSDPALRSVGEALQRVWQRDPLTAARPFPALRVVESTASPTCASARFSASGPLLLACPASGEILVHRGKLAALHGVFGEGAEAFVAAYGLAQLLGPSQRPQATAEPSATAGLQAACRAGTLLGALPIPTADRRLVLNNAISAAEQAFDSSASGQLGTGPQRAYAVLSGMGGTNLDCGAKAMALLGSGKANIEPFLATRGTSVGIDVFCRQPPSCPRYLGFSLALP